MTLRNLANRVYNVLVRVADAPEIYRGKFLIAFANGFNDPTGERAKWEIGGKFDHIGELVFSRKGIYVSCGDINSMHLTRQSNELLNDAFAAYNAASVKKRVKR